MTTAPTQRSRRLDVEGPMLVAWESIDRQSFDSSKQIARTVSDCIKTSF